MNIKSLTIKSLVLDLQNYRTVHQRTQISAVRALILSDTGRFWALTESLLENGYLPVENIIVQNIDGKTVVKEGNRRIAALKIIHGMLSSKDLQIPEAIAEKISLITKEWKQDNLHVPCLIFSAKDSKVVAGIIARTHGKGELAGRANWLAIARARHNRDANGDSEPGLDLLEKFLQSGKNISKIQSELWAGDYPISVLNEALSKLAPRVGFKNSRDLSDAYPSAKKIKGNIDKLLFDIGTEVVVFKTIRSPDDFTLEYGATAAEEKNKEQDHESGSDKTKKPDGKDEKDHKQGASKEPNANKDHAFATNDPRGVAKKLKGFKPAGKNRDKLVTLLNELRLLKIQKTPHAFCFVLRSMFELSAKAYCIDHGPHEVSYKKQSGKRNL